MASKFTSRMGFSLNSRFLYLIDNLKFLLTCLIVISKFSSVQFSHSVASDSLRPHELQYARPPCPSPSPGVHSNSCPSNQWCHPAISSSVVPFSSCSQSLPASESFPMSQFFAWGGQSTGVSALGSFLPKNTQGWSPLEWTGWISLQLVWSKLSLFFPRPSAFLIFPILVNCNCILLVAEAKNLDVILDFSPLLKT